MRMQSNRRKTKNDLQYVCVGVSASVFMVAVMAGCVLSTGAKKEALAMFGMAAVMAAMMIARILWDKRSKDRLVEECMTSIAYYSFDRCEYLPKVGFSEQNVLGKNILRPCGKKFESRNMLKGEYKSTPFKIAEVSYGDFQGLWLEIPYPEEHFDGVRIMSLDLPQGKNLMMFSREDSLQFCESASQDFNNMFQCYFADPSFADTVLVSSRINDLYNIRKEIGCPFMISYQEKEMIVAIRTDYLMPELFNPEEGAEIEQSGRMEKAVKSFTDYLQSDYNIMPEAESSRKKRYLGI